ncbi:uncharacterized protein [Ptychodera flava]|uniref:uncharacterized protein n=1 Tax=Ptychodera flava TaxID=63121 RepID=UPI003969D145
MVDGNKINWKEAECVTSQNETVYVNDEGINHIEVAWTTFFRGAESYPSRPVYVKDFKVGIVGSWLVFRIYSGGKNANCVYCVLLTVTDKAGNHDNAMRYLMFDNVNTPHIDNTGHYPIRVESAAQNTSYTWITNASPTIRVKWIRHFANEFHKNAGLLNAIDDYSLNVLPAYDELTGQPPYTRSREEILNGHGIIKFEVALGVDQQGGESLTGATEWFNVNDVEAEEVEITISHQDGDTIRIWIKGQDAIENVIQDNVTVHSDSTPPEIGEMYLTRNGVEYLAVHNSEDLHEMRVIFDAFDDHSGLSVVYWELFDMNNSSFIHGEGSLPVVRVPITVDNSPPHEGSVHDSLPDNPDVDYQQGTQIFASWDGFFDRESGIMLYVYYFGTDCLHHTDVTFPIETPLMTTISTQAEWTVPLPDRYHCTVIAYNRAMQASNPVCSDGVTVDASEPIITDVVVDDIYIKAGLVNDGNGTVWFIDENRERKRVLHASEACM